MVILIFISVKKKKKKKQNKEERRETNKRNLFWTKCRFSTTKNSQLLLSEPQFKIVISIFSDTM